MTNITTDNIFEDIGFDKQEAANLKVRAILLIEIKEYIRRFIIALYEILYKLA